MFTTKSATKVGRVFALAASVAIASFLTLGKAQAVTLTLEGGTSGTLQANFDPGGWTNPDGIKAGYTGLTIYNSGNAGGGNGLFASPQNVRLTFEYLGREAGNTNLADSELSWDGSAMFSTKTSKIGDTFSALYNVGSNPGLVPFLFRTLAEFTGGVAQSAINGGPIQGTLGLAFSEIFVSGLDQYVYAFFEDGATDGDFDDMIVRITASVARDGAGNEVPLPPALVLFASALFGLTLLGRRRRSSRQAMVSA